jgi:hypothetical protein
MALFTSYRRNQGTPEENGRVERLVVDLGHFTVGQTPLGKPPWEGDGFTGNLLESGVFELPSSGYELALREGMLDSLTVRLAQFTGTFLLNGQKTELDQNTTLEEVLALFGEPYWTDQDEDETLLFYEYRGGSIELQCEFPDGRHLRYLTLMQNGILSRPDQRESYGVTREWPPTNGD